MSQVQVSCQRVSCPSALGISDSCEPAHNPLVSSGCIIFAGGMLKNSSQNEQNRAANIRHPIPQRIFVLFHLAMTGCNPKHFNLQDDPLRALEPHYLPNT